MRIALFAIFLVTGFWYGALVFPYAYFRHDDWLILGNAVLPRTSFWKSVFSPTLFFADQEMAWFFRPGFKLLTRFFYFCFGFSYWAWLSGLYVLFLLSLYFFSRVLRMYSPKSENLFWILSLGCIHLHMGSLAWAGEGLMNIPQVFFLSLALWFYVEKKSVLGLLSYVLALGFKESSVFFVAVLAVLPGYQIKKLIPYLVPTILYLCWRLFGVPINSQYTVDFDWRSLFNSAAIFGASLTLPLVFTAAYFKLKPRWAYAIPILLFLGPHLVLGHGFFSPGWLYLPGVFFLFFLALSLSPSVDLVASKALSVGVLVTLFSLSPVILQMRRLQWWTWKMPQQQMHALVREAAGTPKELRVLNCQRAKDLRLERVVGFEASLHELWRLHHSNAVGVRFLPCDSAVSRSDYKDNLILRWEFPTFVALNNDVGFNSLPSQTQ